MVCPAFPNATRSSCFPKPSLSTICPYTVDMLILWDGAYAFPDVQSLNGREAGCARVVCVKLETVMKMHIRRRLESRERGDKEDMGKVMLQHERACG